MNLELGVRKKVAKRRAARAFVSGLGMGAAVGYLLDPSLGKRRRGRVRDRLIHELHQSSELFAKGTRDAVHRTRGVLAEARGAVARRHPSDAVLVDRVRAELGRIASHPHALHVGASQGTVALEGPILAAEVDEVVSRIERVPGVAAVVRDGLEVHASPEGAPSLQGAPRRRPSRAWPPGVRLLALLAGAGLTTRGLLSQSAGGYATALLGAAIAWRGIDNRRTRLQSARRGRRAWRTFEVHKTIEVQAPVEEVATVLTHLEGLPVFVRHVKEVRPVAEGRSHWTVVGKAGVPVEFDSQLVEIEDHRRIVWKTVDHGPVAHEGIVRFDETPTGGTRIDVRMSYAPAFGLLGRLVGLALGIEPKRVLDEDLVRVKSLFENGKTRIDGRLVEKEKVLSTVAARISERAQGGP